MSRRKRSLSCFHRNQTLLAMQVQILIQLARLGQALLQEGLPIPTNLETLLRFAGGELGRLYGGTDSTYRADSARRIMKDSNAIETINQIRKHFVSPKGQPKPLQTTYVSDIQPDLTWEEEHQPAYEGWGRRFRILLLERSDIVRTWALLLVIIIALLGGITLSQKWMAHWLAVGINTRYETAIAGTKSPSPSSPPYSYQIKMTMTPWMGLPGVTEFTPTPVPTSTPTFTPTATPVRVGFLDGQGDTFDRASQTTYLDPQADITSLEVYPFNEGCRIAINMAAPFYQEDYSYAISTVMTDTVGQTHTFLYQIHDGNPTIGEVNNYFQPLPDSPVYLDYNSNTGQLLIQLPSSYLQVLTPPFTISVESFHMSTPTSVWSGDVTNVFGPFEFPGFIPPAPQSDEISGGQPMLYLDTGAFCRAGPDKEYPEEWSLNAGNTVPIVGSYPNGWWLVKIDDPRTRTECCWVGAGTPLGDTSAVPSITTLPPGGFCP
jgi:hypothetical protein